jgi:hypothetical protein
MRVRWPSHTIIAAALACFPAAVSAVTLDQVLAMSKAGVSDTVILEMIARDKTLVTIAPDQVIVLRREGVSDAVMVALLKSGVPTEESLREDPGPPPPVAPLVAFVGHSAQWPNVGRHRFYDSPPAVVAVPVPVAVPYAPSRRLMTRRPPERVLERTSNPLLCLERISVAGSAFAPPYSRIAECPAPMQRYREQR